MLGKALLPLQGSGKVHVGQRVHIRLNNYPDQEFGYVKGQVASISCFRHFLSVKILSSQNQSYSSALFGNLGNAE